jgi:hypothetical protein
VLSDVTYADASIPPSRFYLYNNSALYGRACLPRAQTARKVATLAILCQTDVELSLQQHLDLAPDLLNYPQLITEEVPQPLMMAQQVPHQSTDKKRVKVYELRNNDWFDRGTGFCTAAFMQVRLSWSLKITACLSLIGVVIHRWRSLG